MSDFIRKPFDRTIVKKRVENITELYTYKNQLEEEIRIQTEEIFRKNERLQKINDNIIELLGNVVEARSLESGQHVKRVKRYTKILSTEMMRLYPEYGLTPQKIEVMVSASALHDVGKIKIKDSVLLKPGKLTDEEFAYMKTHTTLGCDMLKDIDGMWSEGYGEVSYQICRYHHEKYDGRGYPDGLVGDDIPIAAQIVSFADVYDALVHERVYKKAFSPEVAYNMITGGECGAYSEKIMQCFANVREKMEQVLAEDSK